MASYLQQNQRRVIPNWRELKKAACLGELNDNTFSLDHSYNKEFVKKYIEDWEFSKTIGTAADLLNASFIADFSNVSVLHAALFIIEHEKWSSPELIKLAKRFLKSEVKKKTNTLLDYDNLEEFQHFFQLKSIYEKIRFQKEKVNKDEKNAFAWVELARLYSLINEKEKAIRAMEIGRNLFPDNRYITRVSTRLLIHYKEFEKALYVIRGNRFFEIDPWILSIDLSLSLIMERKTPFIKKGLALIENKKINLAELTELTSSLGTLFFYEGNILQSKKMFNLSLKSPNDNTIAQAEWIKSNNINLNTPENTNHIINPFEAMAMDKFLKGDWKSSFESATKWLFDLPYSKRPIVMGSYIAILLKDFGSAETLCKIGLQANPSSCMIINNYCYALARQNKTDEATTQLNKIALIPEIEISSRDKVVLNATNGLILFRKGMVDLARDSYQKTMEGCLRLGDKYLYRLALLNLFREEILIKSERVEGLKQEIEKELKDESNPDIKYVREEIFNSYYVARINA